MHSVDPIRGGHHFTVIQSHPNFVHTATHISWGELVVIVGAFVLVAMGISVVLLVVRRRGRVGLFRAIGSGLGTLVWTLVALAAFGYWADGTWRVLGKSKPIKLRSKTVQAMVRAAKPVIGRSTTPPQASTKETTSSTEMVSFGRSVYPQGSHVEGPDYDKIAVRVLTEEAKSGLPAWVQEGCRADKEGSRVVVVSQQFATPEESRRQLLQLVNRLVHEAAEPRDSSGFLWTPPEPLVRSEIIGREHIQEIEHDFGKVTGKMYRVYWELRMSPRIREKLFDSWRTQVVEARVSVLGALFGMIALIATSLAGYFILDSRTRGECRGRLKLAAAAVVVAGSLLTPVLLSQLSPHWSQTLGNFPF